MLRPGPHTGGPKEDRWPRRTTVAILVGLAACAALPLVAQTSASDRIADRMLDFDGTDRVALVDTDHAEVHVDAGDGEIRAIC